MLYLEDENVSLFFFFLFRKGLYVYSFFFSKKREEKGK